jgi:diguanylate cyclase (GGDEF)-like protein
MVPLPEQDGLFVSACNVRQAEFRSSCAELFGRLQLVQHLDQAAEVLSGEAVGLLVIDLERCEPSLDLAALEAMLAARAGLRTLLLCPWDRAGWLAPLLRFAGVSYAMAPLGASELAGLVAAELAGTGPAAGTADQDALRAMFGVHAAFSQVLSPALLVDDLLAHGCAALSLWPGVAHVAMFRLEDDGDVRLAAQHGTCGLDLDGLLRGREEMLHASRRHTFPGLLAALSGEMTLLDSLSKACEPDLAQALRRHGVRMALGLPIPADGPGAPRGVLCLLFGAQRQFDGVEIAALGGLGQLAGLGMQVDALRRDRAAMQERVAQVVTTDVLTGAASRRHGETLLEREVRRSRRHRLPLVLLAFDIDNFRQINHQFGLPVGDVALRSVADCVRAQLRSHDVLIRSGSEEFQVIAPHCAGPDGVRLAEKLRAALAAEAIPGCDRITVSIGVAELAANESPDGLELRADVARSRAKRGGGNRVELALH